LSYVGKDTLPALSGGIIPKASRLYKVLPRMLPPDLKRKDSRNQGENARVYQDSGDESRSGDNAFPIL